MPNITFPFIVPAVGQAFITKFNRLIGGIVGLVLTTVILFWGLDGYEDGTKIMFLFIPIPKSVFIGSIVLWYLADLGCVFLGIEERKASIAQGDSILLC